MTVWSELKLGNWAAPTFTHNETTGHFCKATAEKKCVKKEPVGVHGNSISMVSFSGEIRITDRHTKQRHCRCADSHIQPMSPFWNWHFMCTSMCMVVTEISVLLVYGVFAYRFCVIFILHEKRQCWGGLADDSKTVIFCLSVCLRVSHCWCWCYSRASQLYHGTVPARAGCVCVYWQRCVKACLCVHVLGWVHSFSIWPVCHLGCIALCVGHCVFLILVCILLVYFWSLNCFIWQNQGCIMDLTSALGLQISQGEQGMNAATVLVKTLFFSY